MAVVKKEKSQMISFFRIVDLVSGVPSVGGQVQFTFNKMVKIKSIQISCNVGTPTFVRGIFKDATQGDLIAQSTRGITGFGANPSSVQGFALSSNNQLIFENLEAGGVDIREITTNTTKVGATFFMHVEYLESFWVEE